MKYNFELTSNECGIGAMALLFRALNHETVPINEIRAKAIVTERGMDIAQMVTLGAHLGITLTPVQINLAELRGQTSQLPLIALVRHNRQAHYVVIKVKPRVVEVHDPLAGKAKYNWLEFATLYLGYALIVEGKNPYQPRLTPLQTGQTKTFLLIFNLFLAVTTIIGSLFIKTIFDLVVPERNMSALIGIVLLFVTLHLLRLVQINIIEYVTNSKVARISAEYERAYFRALVNHEYHYLRAVKIEVHLQNLQNILEIAFWQTSAASSILSNFLICMVALVVMLALAPALLPLVIAIAALTALLNVYAVFVTSHDARQVEAAGQKRLQLWIENFNRLLALRNPLEMSAALSQLNNDMTLRERLSAALGRKYQALRSGAFILETFLPLSIAAIGVIQIINDRLSNGNLLLFLNMMSVYLLAQQQLSTYALKYKPYKRHYENLKSMTEISPPVKAIKTITKQLTKIEIANFRPASVLSSAPIKNLVITADTHLLGANGVGKSTFLLALYGALPYYGAIYWNGDSLKNIDSSEIAKRTLLLSSSSYLPTTTLAEFWKLDAKVGEKVRAALTTEDGIKILEHLNLHLSLKIEQGGAIFSTGQKQFIAALQALHTNYELILNDESLDHIDQTSLQFIQNLFAAEPKRFIEVSHGNKFFKKEAIKYELKFENKL